MVFLRFPIISIESPTGQLATEAAYDVTPRGCASEIFAQMTSEKLPGAL